MASMKMRYFLSALGLLAALLLVAPPAFAFKMEAGAFQIGDTFAASPTFTTQAFQQTYDVVPVVFVLTTNQGGDSSVVRIRNVTTTGFEAVMVEPPGEDGPHIAMDVHYFAIEPGTHTMTVSDAVLGPRTITLEAGVLSTSQIISCTAAPSNCVGSFDTHNFAAPFATTPVVQLQLQTFINGVTGVPPAPPVPYITASADNVSAAGFDFVIDRHETTGGTLSPAQAASESIGYLALDSNITAADFLANNAQMRLIELETIRVDSAAPNAALGWNNGCNRNINFSKSYPQRLVAATKQSRLENDGGWLRRCNLTATRLRVVVDEDVDGDNERGKAIPDGVGVLLASRDFFFDSNFAPAQPSPNFKMEANSVTMTPGAFTLVTLDQYYEDPPAVFFLADSSDPEPAAVRVLSVFTSPGTGVTRFLAVLDEPPNETAGGPPSEVHYIAVEHGSHVFPDGTQMEVGEALVGAVQQNFGGTDSFQAITFDAPFGAPPAVLAQIEGFRNNPAIPLSIWMTVAYETGSTTATGFEMALERSEVNAGGPILVPELVKYLAIDRGTIGAFFDNEGNTVTGEAQFTRLRGNSNAGWDDICFLASYPGIPFLNTYTDPPIVVAHEMSHRGGDGGWHRRCALTNTHVRIAEDEDRFANNERAHTAEDTGLVAFSQAFAVDFSLAAFYPMEEAAWNPGVAGQVDNLRDSFHDGTPNDDADTAQVTPARTVGTDGTCRYGEFDGTQSGLVAADGVNAGSDDVILADELTVAAWVRWAAAPGSRNAEAVIVRNDTVADFSDYQFSLNATGTGARFAFSVVTTDGVGTVTTGNFAATGQWYYLTGVYDGAELRFYVDGVEVASAVHTGDIVAHDAARELTVGRSSEASANHHGFDGLIDEVRIYRRALPQEEIDLARLTVRDCPIVLHDNYAVTHAGIGVTCEAEEVLITARILPGTPHPPPAGTIMTITASAADQWAIGSIGAPARFADLGGGSASYEFDGIETEVELLLSRTVADIVTFTITDTLGRSHDPAATPPLEFKEVVIDIAPPAPAIASRPQPLTLQIIEDTGTGVCQAATPPPGTVDFAVECLDPASGCTGLTAGTVETGGTNYPVPAADSGTAVPGGAVPLTFDASSESSFNLSYNDAGQVRLHASAVTGTPSVTVTGMSLPFAVRPFGFIVDVPGDPGGPPTAGRDRFVPADTPFTVTLTPVDWQAADDTDDNGIVDGAEFGDTDPTNTADLSDNRQLLNYRTLTPATLDAYLVAPTGAGTSDPGITDGGSTPVNVGPFVATSESLATVQYDEVGVIEISAAQSGDYLGFGAATSDIRGASGAIGRFIPARYQVAASNFNLRNGTGTWTCGMTYLGQEFGYAATPTLTVTAETASGAPAENYGGGFFRFSSTPTRSYADLTSPALAPTVTLTDLGAGFTISDETDFGDASFELLLNDDRFRYERGELQVPFEPTIELTIAAADLVDDDDACFTTGGSVCNTSLGPDLSADYVKNDITTAGVELRFGRLVLENAFGSELQALPVPMAIEYYEDLGTDDDFTTDGADDCTTLDLAGAVRLTGSGGEQDGNTMVPLIGSGTTRLLDSFPPAVAATDPAFSASEATLLFEPPTPAGSTGFVDIRIDLSVDSLEYLRYDWGSGSFTDDPTARASFGLFPGRREIIYIREPWD